MQGKKGKVLLIDDQPEYVLVVKHHLIGLGYDVHIAESGQTAISYIADTVPDIILLDVLMPDMDGFETCRQLKADKHTSDIPILFMSGIDAEAEKVRGFAVGGVDYITKPFQLNEITARIETHLTIKRLKDQLEQKNATLEKEISERKQTEKALKESEDRYRKLVEFSPSGILVHIDTTIEFVNSEAIRLLGASYESDLVGRNFTDFIHPDFFAPVHARTRNVNQEEFSEKIVQQKFIRIDGRIMDVEVTGAAIDYRGKKAFLVTFRDITDLKRAEVKIRKYSLHLEQMVRERTKKLKKTQEELLVKERLAVLGHFAGSLSHELRNPLAAIDSSAYFLGIKLNDRDEKIRDHLQRIASNVGKAVDIIESLLNLSQMKKPATTEHCVSDLIDETIRSINIPALIDVVTRYSDASLHIHVDFEQLRMALKNIVNNSIQSMGSKGKLEIIVDNTEKGDVRIQFSDSGPGIHEAYLEKIFEPLFTTRAQGIGFGLSITKMIVENHGGTIRADSRPGSGAVIILTFPAADDNRHVSA